MKRLWDWDTGCSGPLALRWFSRTFAGKVLETLQCAHTGDPGAQSLQGGSSVASLPPLRVVMFDGP